MLLCDALGMGQARLLAQASAQLPLEAYLSYQRRIDRLAAGEPLQYVMGHWEFFGREFVCDARALIPREDTETLVRAALCAVPEAAQRVLDVGCGSGCIAITWSLERPQDETEMCDISDEALGLAGQNARLLGASVRAFAQDMCTPLARRDYTVLLSNPPYIAPGETDVEESVLAYEPHLALFAGEDGLEFYRALADRAAQSLLPGGVLAVECGHTQARGVKELFLPLCSGVEILRDGAGIERVVLGRKKT